MIDREWTCGRCGLTDPSVLNLDTGGTYHAELRHCIEFLRHELSIERTHADMLDVQVRSWRERFEGGVKGYVVLEIAPAGAPDDEWEKMLVMREPHEDDRDSPCVLIFDDPRVEVEP